MHDRVMLFPSYFDSHIDYMELGNDTRSSKFLLLGSLEEPELQPFLFGLFLSMYLVTILGNLLIILAVKSDSHLHTPMYFFLDHLSFINIYVAFTTVPQMGLYKHRKVVKVITYESCVMQMYFFILFVGLDNFLLTDNL